MNAIKNTLQKSPKFEKDFCCMFKMSYVKLTQLKIRFFIEYMVDSDI